MHPLGFAARGRVFGSGEASSLIEGIQGLVQAAPEKLNAIGAVGLSPWKHRYTVSVIALLCVVAVYAVFPPLGIAG